MRNVLVDIFVLFVGGGIGTVVRYLMGLISYNTHFPCSTLIVNIISSLIFGFFYAHCVQKMDVPVVLQLMLLTGFCGGLSTMSSFTFESWSLYEKGMYFLLALNIFLNYTLPICAVMAGVYLGRQI